MKNIIMLHLHFVYLLKVRWLLYYDAFLTLRKGHFLILHIQIFGLVGKQNERATQ